MGIKLHIIGDYSRPRYHSDIKTAAQETSGFVTTEDIRNLLLVEQVMGPGESWTSELPRQFVDQEVQELRKFYHEVDVTGRSRNDEFLKLQEGRNILKAAYMEVMTKAYQARTWITGLPALGSIDELLALFRCPAQSGMRVECSTECATVPMEAYKLVSFMMQRVSWREACRPPACILPLLQYTDVGILGIVVGTSKSLLPIPWVQLQKFQYLRFSRQILPDIWAVIDVSVEYFQDTSSSSSAGPVPRRRPSGLIIRRRESSSEIIWVENVEVKELPVCGLFSQPSSSYWQFLAERWVKSLLHLLGREDSRFITCMMQLRHDDRRRLLNLAESKKALYTSHVIEPPDEELWDILLNESTRILRGKIQGPDELQGSYNFVVQTTFCFQAKPISVFDFLAENNLELLWNSFSQDEPIETIKLVSEDYSNCITLHMDTKRNRGYLLQEASREEFCSFIISSLMSSQDFNRYLYYGIEGNLHTIPSGFAIMSDGYGGLHSNASVVTISLGMQLNVQEADGAIRKLTDTISIIYGKLLDEVQVSSGYSPSPDHSDETVAQGVSDCESTDDSEVVTSETSHEFEVSPVLQTENLGEASSSEMTNEAVVTRKRKQGSDEYNENLGPGESSTMEQPRQSLDQEVKKLARFYKEIDDMGMSRKDEFLKLQKGLNIIKAAYMEVMTKAYQAGTWVSGLPALGSIDELLELFHGPAPSGMRVKCSTACAIVPIKPYKLVSLMMDRVKRGGAYSPPACLLPLVQYTDIGLLDVDQIVMGTAENLIPIPWMPLHKFQFLRFSRQILPDIWAVIDISVDYFQDPSSSSSAGSIPHRRPSGVIIRRHESSSEIIWVENMEVKELQFHHDFFSPTFSSYWQFHAERWVNTLSHFLKRRASGFITRKVPLHHDAGRFLLEFTDYVKALYTSLVIESPGEEFWDILLNDNVRMLRCKAQVPVELQGFDRFVVQTTLRLEAKPISVFNFLTENNMKLLWDSSFGKEAEEIIKLATEDYSNCITLHKDTEHRYLLQEASRREFCSFITSSLFNGPYLSRYLSYGIEGNMPPDPSGFAIMSEGFGGLHSTVSVVTISIQRTLPVREEHETIQQLREIMGTVFLEMMTTFNVAR